MRRPLALFGLVWMTAQLACALFAQKLPLWAFWTLAAFFLAAGLLLCRGGKTARHRAALCLLAAAVALCWHGAWRQRQQKTIALWAAAPVQAEGIVVRTGPAGENERAGTELRLMPPPGLPGARGVTVWIASMPAAAPGTRVRGTFRLAAADAAQLAAGRLLVGRADGDPVVVGRSDALFYRFGRLQQRLSLALRRQYLPQIGAVAAAICLGDRTALTPDLRAAYRRAGIAHLLVVSGLHLTVLTNAVACLLPRRRRFLRAAVLAAVTVGFVLLTGCSLSVLRSGIMVLFVLAAPLVDGEADPLTSLAAAALVLTAANPAAAADVGLLLSFSATLGLLLASAWLQRRAADAADEDPHPRRAAFLRLLLPTAAVPLATLPVLIAIGSGISVFSVAVNLLAQPLMAPLLVSGLLTAVCAGRPALGLLYRPAALICGVLVRLLNWVAAAAAALPFGVLHLSGGYALFTVLAVFALAAAALELRGRSRRFALAGTSAFLLLSVLLGAALSAGTVRAALVGFTAQPAVVLVRGDKAAILWRGGRANAAEVKDYLETRGVREVTLFLNCTGSSDDLELRRSCRPQQYANAAADFVFSRSYAPLAGVSVSVRRQGAGSVFAVCSGGAALVFATGKTDLRSYGRADVFFAGTQLPTGLKADLVLAGEGAPAWVENCGLPLRTGERPEVWLRPGRSMKLLEVT